MAISAKVQQDSVSHQAVQRSFLNGLVLVKTFKGLSVEETEIETTSDDFNSAEVPLKKALGLAPPMALAEEELSDEDEATSKPLLRSKGSPEEGAGQVGADSAKLKRPHHKDNAVTDEESSEDISDDLHDHGGARELRPKRVREAKGNPADDDGEEDASSKPTDVTPEVIEDLLESIEIEAPEEVIQLRSKKVRETREREDDFSEEGFQDDLHDEGAVLKGHSKKRRSKETVDGNEETDLEPERIRGRKDTPQSQDRERELRAKAPQEENNQRNGESDPRGTETQDRLKDEPAVERSGLLGPARSSDRESVKGAVATETATAPLSGGQRDEVAHTPSKAPANAQGDSSHVPQQIHAKGTGQAAAATTRQVQEALLFNIPGSVPRPGEREKKSEGLFSKFTWSNLLGRQKSAQRVDGAAKIVRSSIRPHSEEESYFFRATDDELLYRLGDSFYRDYKRGTRHFAFANVSASDSQKRSILGVASFINYFDGCRILIITDRMEGSFYGNFKRESARKTGLCSRGTGTLYEFYNSNSLSFIEVSEFKKVVKTGSRNPKGIQEFIRGLLSDFDVVLFDLPHAEERKSHYDVYLPLLQAIDSVTFIISLRNNRFSEINQLKDYFNSYKIRIKGSIIENNLGRLG